MDIQIFSNKDYLLCPLVQGIESKSENFHKIQCCASMRYNSFP